MKKTTGILIALWAVIGVAALGLLIAYATGWGGLFETMVYGTNERELIQEKSFSPSSVEDIVLSLGSEEISFHPAEDADIVIKQYGRNLGENRVLSLSEQDGKLHIKRNSGVAQFFSFGFIMSQSWVEVYLPEGYDGSLHIGLASGSLTFYDDISLDELEIALSSGHIQSENTLRARDAEIKVTSGRIVLENLFTESAYLHTTSGNIDIRAMSGTAEVDVTSGRIKVSELHLGEEFDVKVTSGTVNIGLAGEPSFRFEGHVTSGTLDTYFDTYSNSRENRKFFADVGENPESEVTVSVTSGTVRIDEYTLPPTADTGWNTEGATRAPQGAGRA
ncbi:DUF4097 domain-containing protein [Oscillospiraceae bacterium OttesenSCG-928-G22]|nr:DUF4097 domain-containing protein [Oscillospiraceae bacterium OttesenSCG-928-G22]